VWRGFFELGEGEEEERRGLRTGCVRRTEFGYGPY
jgi:hypothetical protein